MSGINFIVGNSKSGISLLVAILECSKNARVDKPLQLAVMDIANHLNCPAYCKEKINSSIQKTDANYIVPLYLDFPLYLEKGIAILDWLNVLKWIINPKITWMVRDPVINSVACQEIFDASIDSLAYYWEDINTCLWYWFYTFKKCDRYFIKFEELLVNPHQCKGVFNTFGLSFNEQFIQYGDFDHEFDTCSNFVKTGRIDVEKIDPYELPETFPESHSGIKTQLGYNNVCRSK